MKIKKDFILAFTISSIAVILDQVSKLVILKNKFLLPIKITSFDGLNLVYVENKGVSFGMLSQYNIPFWLGILSFAISVYVIFLIIKSDSKLELIGLSMILGGAVGNGLDRLFRGYVIDFIDFYYRNYHWPAFNFADSFITVGAVLFVVKLIFYK
tara:strand:+ start:37 stop:501 length:465 start_codon:yes stop_codon:yes gene_type:complete